MSKTYSTPRLVASGDVVAVTKSFVIGEGDPQIGLEAKTPGSVGFGL